ncbi:hypothetical protein GCM10027074_78260 [Streptomyces deserti]
MGVAVLDDVNAAGVGAALRGGVDYRGEPLPGADADPGEDDGGELLAGAGDEATADGGSFRVSAVALALGALCDPAPDGFPLPQVEGGCAA